MSGPALAAELIVDNPDGPVQVKGKWSTTTTTGGFQGADYLFRTAGDGSASVVWPFPGSTAGRYEVFARWSSGINRATNATYEISWNGGAQPVIVNQKNNGGAWQSLGSFDFQPGKSQGVKITDKADGVVVADNSANVFVAASTLARPRYSEVHGSPPPADAGGVQLRLLSLNFATFSPGVLAF